MPQELIYKKKKLFAILRIFYGIALFLFPLNEYIIKNHGLPPEGQEQWIFVVFFFFIYAFSSVNNGIKEWQGKLPAFNLLRFFEVSMNGLISGYAIILLVTYKLNPLSLFLLIFFTAGLILSFVRDLRILSLQYYERKKNAKK